MDGGIALAEGGGRDERPPARVDVSGGLLELAVLPVAAGASAQDLAAQQRRLVEPGQPGARTVAIDRVEPAERLVMAALVERDQRLDVFDRGYVGATAVAQVRE
ncbi:MAG TPA: hypothetical protein VF516_28080, partial [Kofleriaceae bacterium]